MSDPNHPIFKQFTELDPSMIVIRDTPHPDLAWNQPPIMGTLTPGYAHGIPGQSYTPGSNEPRALPTSSSQIQARPQRWQPDFPGLWDDIPNSGTTSISHSQTHPALQSNSGLPAYSEERAGPAGRLPEHQGRPEDNAGDAKTTEPKHYRP